MAPFKSSAGRQLGKMLEGFKSSDVGKGFGSGDTGGFLASGGTKTQPGDGFIYHTYDTVGSFDFFAVGGPKQMEIEVQAGGGGGSSGWQAWAGGGGGGGYAHFSRVTSPGPYTIVVGAGGQRNSNCGSGGGIPNGALGYNGADSTAFGATANGGQGGANAGSSGGGGGGYSIPGVAGQTLATSGNGDNGNNTSNDGSGWGGANGKKATTPSWTAWGQGAAGVPNSTPGNDAPGYGNGGGGGHSCQTPHNGGGTGSPGIVIIKYPE